MLVNRACSRGPDDPSPAPPVTATVDFRTMKLRMGNYVEIKVTDTGVGIDPEELPKIFDKFYRVKHQKTRQVMGTGLGLSIVKGIVEAHHGTIDVESTPNEGTTFRILLPVAATDE